MASFKILCSMRDLACIWRAIEELKHYEIMLKDFKSLRD